jgi:transcription elongation factor GreA
VLCRGPKPAILSRAQSRVSTDPRLRLETGADIRNRAGDISRARCFSIPPFPILKSGDMLTHSMNPEIQKAVEAGKIPTSSVATLEQLVEGACVTHKSWGFGRIAGIDFLLNQVRIDFASKTGHLMQLEYAAQSLTPIEPDHILSRIAHGADAVRLEANNDPVAFTASVLADYGNKRTQDEFTRILVPALFSEAEFKRWWDGAKKLLKKDGHFSFPAKKTDPIVFQSESVSHADQHLSAFQQARQPKDQIVALEKILRHAKDFAALAPQLQTVLENAEEAARKNLKLKTAECLTLIILRDEIVERAEGVRRGPDALTLPAILLEEQRNLTALLEEIPAAKLKRALAAFQEAFGEDWSAKALSLVSRGSTRLVAEAARLLQEHGKTAELRTSLDRSIRDHSISSAALTWLCDKKERNKKDGEFRTLLHPRVVSALLSALERDQFNENRDRKLHDLLVGDEGLLPELIANAEVEEVREAMRKLLLSPVFEDLNKRSLLGRFVRAYPELEALISGEREEKQESLVVSWESLQRRQEEYEEIINKKIPENTRDIAEAAAHGDLKENAEFKAAKETQRMLGRRRADLEKEIMTARGTDFANADIAQVSIGTSVRIRNAGTSTEETFHILGAWDGDVEKGIISYKAPIARALIGHKLGESVELATDRGSTSVEIISIEAWNKGGN